VTVSWSCASGALLAAALFPHPVAARQRTVTDETVTMGDAAMTPLEDLNLSKDPIPPVLLRAKTAPYREPGTLHCADVLAEIGDLDAVLGEDFDTASDAKAGFGAGKIAQRVIGMLIPYRGVIRTLSGADRHEAEFRQAIAAGLVRRAYLKGLGQGLDCPYPARPAPPEMIAAAILKREEAAREEEEEEATQGREVPVEGDGYVSEPVVQPTP
jgi:hypothetical protein